MKAPILKRYKIANDKLMSLNPLGRKLIDHLGYDSGDGQSLVLMELQDAYEVRIIVNPLECIEMLELKEIRDDEI